MHNSYTFLTRKPRNQSGASRNVCCFVWQQCKFWVLLRETSSGWLLQPGAWLLQRSTRSSNLVSFQNQPTFSQLLKPKLLIWFMVSALVAACQLWRHHALLTTGGEHPQVSSLHLPVCNQRISELLYSYSLIKQWTITRVLLKLDRVPLYKNCEMHNKWNSTRERVCRRLWGHFKARRRSAVTENGKNAGGAKSICYMHLQVFVNMFLISFHFDILTPHKTSFIFLHFNSPTMEPCHTSSHLGSGVGLFIEIFNLKRSCFPCWINEDSSFPNSLWAGEKGEKLFLYRSVPMAAAADPTHQRITWT